MDTMRIVCSNGHDAVVIEVLEHKPINMARTDWRWVGTHNNPHLRMVPLDADGNRVPQPTQLRADDVASRIAWAEARGLDPAAAVRLVAHYTCPRCKAHWPVRRERFNEVCELLAKSGKASWELVNLIRHAR